MWWPPVCGTRVSSGLLRSVADYVANGHGHSVAILDVASARVTEVVPAGRRPWGLALTPDRRKLHTANGLSNDVTVIDTASRKVVRTIPVGEAPWGLTMR